jgi:hypothetical protein
MSETRELLNMIDNIKEKISDREYKELVEKTSQIHLKKHDLYEIKYVKQVLQLDCDNQQKKEFKLYNNIVKYVKTKTVKLLNSYNHDIDDVIEKPLEYGFKFMEKLEDGYETVMVHRNDVCVRVCGCNSKGWAGDIGVQYNEIIVASIKKIL